MYVKLPQNISHLNEFMCGGMDRAGVLCSHCKEGLGIPVFSYNTLHCLSCLESFSGWVDAIYKKTCFDLMFVVYILHS